MSVQPAPLAPADSAYNFKGLTEQFKSQHDGREPTAEELVSEALKAPPPDYHSVVNAAQSAVASITPEEQARIHKEVSDHVTSPEMVENFKKIAADAAQAVREIDTMFRDVKYHLGRLVKPLKLEEYEQAVNQQHDAYLDILRDSRSHAAVISEYALEFEKGIIPAVCDDNVSPDKRLETLKGYEERLAAQQKHADEIVARFHKFSTDMANLFGKLSAAIPADYNKDLDDRCAAVRKRISDLQSKIDGLATASWVVGGVTIGLTVLFAIGVGCLAVLAGPFGPAIVLAGLKAGGLMLGAGGAIVGSMVIARECYKSQQEDARKELADLNQQKKDRDESVTEIKKLTTQQAADRLAQSVANLSAPWVSISQDTAKIKPYLERLQEFVGKPNPNPGPIPPIILYYMERGMTLYATIAQTLDAYSKGIGEV